MKEKKILFIGCVESSFRLLKNLIDKNKRVVGVITKRASAFNSDFCDLTPLCEKHSIPIHYVNNANDEDSLSFIRSLSPDICFCFGWSQLLKEPLLSLFPCGVFGFHPSELPCNRGRHPLIWALVLGLKQTASSFFVIDANADEGDIVSQEVIEITYDDDARSLYDKVMDTAVRQETELVEAIENDRLIRRRQDKNSGNTWRKRGKDDGRIDWRMSCGSIYNLVRGLTKPYAGAHFNYNNMEIKVWRVKEIPCDDYPNIEPGKIIKCHSDGTVDIKAGGGLIRLLEFDDVKLTEGEYLP